MSEDTCSIMMDAAKGLSDIQKKFLTDEFGIASEAIGDITESRWDEIYDILCDMEVDEISNAGDSELSQRGEIICGLVTLFGNAIAENEDLTDE